MIESVAVVVLTKNEEDRIERCLRSLDRVRYVYVVDSGSADSTVELAERKQNVTVLVHLQEGSFNIEEQRNWALAQLEERHDWVLFLDADEVAPPDFLREVDGAVSRSDSETKGFWAAPKFIYQGTWLKRFTGYPNWHSRVMRTSVRLVGGVWETFPSGLSCGYIRVPYLHFPDDRGLRDWFERHVRYAESVSSGIEEGAKSGLRPTLRRLGKRMGLARPLGRVFYSLVLRRGILDGGSVLTYARRIAIYEAMVAEFQLENARAVRHEYTAPEIGSR